MLYMSIYTLPQQQDPVRPTLADLQRAQVAALRIGDRPRAAQYAVLVHHRVRDAQRHAQDQIGSAA
jgi:hypothetical protein